MPDSTLALIFFVALSIGFHLFTTILTLYRTGRPKMSIGPDVSGGVDLLRPVCGLDPYDPLTLGSTFRLAGPRDLNIVFCAARARDAAVPLVRSLIADHPGHDARLLIGDERPTPNPKLNNLVKGWRATGSPWVIMADSNVLLPPDYVATLLAAYRADTGLVCSPPVGSVPEGMAAEIECAFLNTYQARWQLAADTLGFGFAQGKSMLWRRDILEQAGGIAALGMDAAEDAAATKIVRASGHRVRLVDRPFAQPLGRRSARDVWNRQVRWARLRRATFPLFYLPEILAGGMLPLAAFSWLALESGHDPLMAALAFAGLWIGIEVLLARAAGWHIGRMTPVAIAVREILQPALWLSGLLGNSFTWRGTDMNATASISSPIAHKS